MAAASASIRRAIFPSLRLSNHQHRPSPSPLRRLFLRPHHPLRIPLLRLLACLLLGSLLGLSYTRHEDHDPPSVFFPGETAQSDDPRHPRAASRVIENVNSEERSVVELSHAGDLVIVVTPTYNRAMQAYYMTRLGQTLRLVRPPLLWIVVEVGAASFETAELLRRTGVMYRHLTCQRDTGDAKDRGVRQRNTALEHIERHNMDGVVYFADDDNVYSTELFEELRAIRRLGTWPVAMLAQSKSRTILEGPVCNGSKVIGWQTNEKSKRLRRFHVDMSGFAFNSTLLWDRKHWHHLSSRSVRQLDTVKEGFQETTFIEQLVEDESQMEAVPSGCSRIMNWHLHLDSRGIRYPKGWKLSRNLEIVVPLP